MPRRAVLVTGARLVVSEYEVPGAEVAVLPAAPVVTITASVNECSVVVSPISCGRQHQFVSEFHPEAVIGCFDFPGANGSA